MRTPGKWRAGKSRSGYSVVTSPHHKGAVARANYGMADALFIDAASTAATACDEMGYDGEAAIEALPEMLKALEEISAPYTFGNGPAQRDFRAIAGGILARVKGGDK